LSVSLFFLSFVFDSFSPSGSDVSYHGPSCRLIAFWGVLCMCLFGWAVRLYVPPVEVVDVFPPVVFAGFFCFFCRRLVSLADFDSPAAFMSSCSRCFFRVPLVLTRHPVFTYAPLHFFVSPFVFLPGPNVFFPSFFFFWFLLGAFFLNLTVFHGAVESSCRPSWRTFLWPVFEVVFLFFCPFLNPPKASRLTPSSPSRGLLRFPFTACDVPFPLSCFLPFSFRGPATLFLTRWLFCICFRVAIGWLLTPSVLFNRPTLPSFSS